MQFHHVPIMQSQITALFKAVLQHRPAALVLDLTVGGGGHSAALLAALPQLQLHCYDRDQSAVAASQARLAPEFGSRVAVRQDTWASALQGYRARPPPLGEAVCGVLLDCGVSSHQLDTACRGFSFRQEGPLDMRMDSSSGVSAGELVRRLPEAALARVLSVYGEEPLAAPIAAALVARRQQAGGLATTTQLAAEVARVVERLGGAGRRGAATHPATRVFQALRMAVNQELQQLESALEALPHVVQPGGLAAVLTFHSLEDRACKKAFSNASLWQDLLQGPQPPEPEEVASNPRARSAKLRAAVRLPYKKSAGGQGGTQVRVAN